MNCCDADRSVDAYWEWVSIFGYHFLHILTTTDHHCPWTNNCIGYFNYGHFIRFLFYVDVTCSYHLAMVSYRVMATSGRWYHVSCFSKYWTCTWTWSNSGPANGCRTHLCHIKLRFRRPRDPRSWRFQVLCTTLHAESRFTHRDYIVFIISIVWWAIPRLLKAGRKIKLQCYEDMVKLKR